jgi:sulfur carrier protein
MRLRINGEWREAPEAPTVGALIDKLGVSRQAIGVLKNGNVVARERFQEEPVQDGDELEIVRFVGGG